MPPKRKRTLMAGKTLNIQEAIQNKRAKTESTAKPDHNAKIDTMLAQYTPAKIQQLRTAMKKHISGNIGIDYIRSVFYPEYYTSRLPYNLANIATSIVTHKHDMILSTGPEGEGMIFFFPRVTTGPCMFVFTGGWVSQGSFTVTAKTYIDVDKKGQIDATTGATIDNDGFISQTRIVSGIDLENVSSYFSGATVTENKSLAKLAMLGVDSDTPHPLFSNYVAAAEDTGDLTKTISGFTEFIAEYAPLAGLFVDIAFSDKTMLEKMSEAATLGMANFAKKYPNATYTGTTVKPVVAAKINTGSELFYRPPPSGTGSGVGWKAYGPIDYAKYYQTSVLTAASISAQYIGRLEFEGGVWVGSHLQNLPIDQVTTDDIENGSSVVRCRPGEGIRMTYIPTETSDFEFCTTAEDDMNAAGARNSSHLSMKNIAKLTTPVAMKPATLFFNKAAPCIAMYWKGMEPNRNSIRVDFIRRFNMVPNKQLRDLVEVDKPPIDIDPTETVNALFQISRYAPFGGHTFRDSDGTQKLNEIRMNFANTLLLGADARYPSLGEFSSALEAPAGTDRFYSH